MTLYKPDSYDKSFLNSHLEVAEATMQSFASRTRLVGDAPSRRYLWSDSFAVRNFLALEALSGQSYYGDLALLLVDQVHEVLGCHRPDDMRSGRLSGLKGDTAHDRPTIGGLRIGNPLPERSEDEPFLEWKEQQSDGQYFHYLAAWMQALDMVTRRKNDDNYTRWARELCEKAVNAFVYDDGRGCFDIHWKMSIDLKRPLVPSAVHRQALDAYITIRQLRLTAQERHTVLIGDPLLSAQNTMAKMLGLDAFRSDDPLDIGRLLTDASRPAQVMERTSYHDFSWQLEMLASAEDALSAFILTQPLEIQMSDRRPYAELALVAGMAGVRWMEKNMSSDESVFPGATLLHNSLRRLNKYFPLADSILQTWLRPENRLTAAWEECPDTNDVMLAAALLPEGSMVLPRPGHEHGT